MDKKILIIDDEEDFCRVVKINLESQGNFNVDFATDGKKGIKLAKKIHPDLILLDICMPGIDGVEVLKILKKDMKTIKIPVVMLTALLDNLTKEKCSSEYDELYIEKPVDFVVLKEKINEVFNRFRGRM